MASLSVTLSANDRLTPALKSAGTQVERLRRGLASLSSATSSISKGASAVGRSFTNLNNTVGKTKNVFSTISNSFKNIATLGGRLPNIFGRMTSTLSGVNNEARKTPGLFSKMGSAISKVVSRMTVFYGIRSIMNMVVNSVGSALERIDTMDTFERKMKLITGSTEEATSALEELKKSTKGTAYALDTAATAVQNLVLRGLDTEDAVKSTNLWMDAVAAFGKGTNAEFKTVMDAIGKMRTKGTVEMRQLNRLFQVGINPVDAYAKAVGRSASEVQDDLSNKKISADTFLQVVERAFAEGHNGVVNVTGMAKKAGTTWMGTLENMRIAITRGMLEIITATDNAFKVLNDNGLKGVVKDFGVSMEEGMNKVATAIKGILPSILKISKTLYTAFSPIFKPLNTLSKLIGETFVEKGIPALERFADKVSNIVSKQMVSSMDALENKTVNTFNNKILPAIRQAGASINASLGTIIPMILEFGTSMVDVFMNRVLPLLVRFGSYFTTVFVAKIIPAGIKFANTVVPAFLSFGEKVMPLIMEWVSLAIPAFLDLMSVLIDTGLEIAETVLPPLIGLAKVGIASINRFVKNTAPAFKRFMTRLAPIAIAIVKTLIPAIEKIASVGIPAIINFCNVVIAPLLDFVKTIAEAFAGLVNDGIKPFERSLNKASIRLAEMATGMRESWDRFKKSLSERLSIQGFNLNPLETLGNIINGIAEMGGAVVPPVFDALLRIFEELIVLCNRLAPSLGDVGEGIKNMVVWMGEFVLPPVLDTFVNLIAKVADALGKIGEKILPKVKEGIGEVMQAFANIDWSPLDALKESYGLNVDSSVDALIPVLENIVDLVTDMAVGLVNCIPHLITFVSKLQDLCAMVVPPILDKLSGFFGFLKEHLPVVTGLVLGFFTVMGLWPILNNVVGVLDKFGTMLGICAVRASNAKGIFNKLIGVISVFVNPVTLAVGAILTLVTASAYLLAIGVTVEDVQKAFADFNDQIWSFADGISNFMDKIGDFFVNNDDIIAGLAYKLGEMAGTLIMNVISTLGTLIGAGVQLLIDFSKNLYKMLPSFIKTGIALIGGLIMGIIQSIPQVIASIGQIIWNILDTIGQALPDIGRMIGWVCAFVVKLIKFWAMDIYEDIALWFQLVGEYMQTDGGALIGESLDYLWNDVILPWVTSLGQKMWEGFWGGLNALMEGIKEGWDSVMNGGVFNFDTSDAQKNAEDLGKSMDDATKKESALDRFQKDWAERSDNPSRVDEFMKEWKKEMEDNNPLTGKTPYLSTDSLMEDYGKYFDPNYQYQLENPQQTYENYKKAQKELEKYYDPSYQPTLPNPAETYQNYLNSGELFSNLTGYVGLEGADDYTKYLDDLHAYQQDLMKEHDITPQFQIDPNQTYENYKKNSQAITDAFQYYNRPPYEVYSPIINSDKALNQLQDYQNQAKEIGRASSVQPVSYQMPTAYANNEQEVKTLTSKLNQANESGKELNDTMNGMQKVQFEMPKLYSSNNEQEVKTLTSRLNQAQIAGQNLNNVIAGSDVQHYDFDTKQLAELTGATEDLNNVMPGDKIASLDFDADRTAKALRLMSGASKELQTTGQDLKDVMSGGSIANIKLDKSNLAKMAGYIGGISEDQLDVIDKLDGEFSIDIDPTKFVKAGQDMGNSLTDLQKVGKETDETIKSISENSEIKIDVDPSKFTEFNLVMAQGLNNLQEAGKETDKTVKASADNIGKTTRRVRRWHKRTVKRTRSKNNNKNNKNQSIPQQTPNISGTLQAEISVPEITTPFNKEYEKLIENTEHTNNTLIDLSSDLSTNTLDNVTTLTDDVGKNFSNMQTNVQDYVQDMIDEVLDDLETVHDKAIVSTNELLIDMLEKYDLIKDQVGMRLEDLRENALEEFTTIKDKVTVSTNELLITLLDKYDLIKDQVTMRLEALRDNALDEFDTIKTKITVSTNELIITLLNKYDLIKDQVTMRLEDLRENAFDEFTTIKNNGIVSTNELMITLLNKYDLIRDQVTMRLETLRRNALDKFTTMKDNLTVSTNELTMILLNRYDYIRDQITMRLNELRFNITTIFTLIKEIASQLTLEMVTNILNYYAMMRDQISGMMSNTRMIVTLAFIEIKGMAMETTWEMVSGILNYYELMQEQIGAMLNQVYLESVEYFSMIQQNALETTGTMVKGVVELYQLMLETVDFQLQTMAEVCYTRGVEMMEKLFQGILDGINSMFGTILKPLQFVGDTVKNLWDKLKEMPKNIVEGIENGAGGLWDTLKEMPKNLTEGLTNSEFLDNLKNNDILKGIAGVGSDLWTLRKGEFEGRQDMYGEYVQKLLDCIPEQGDTTKDIFDKGWDFLGMLTPFGMGETMVNIQADQFREKFNEASKNVDENSSPIEQFAKNLGEFILKKPAPKSNDWFKDLVYKGSLLIQNAGDVLGFATGTKYVPEDMLAVIHQGEAIIPNSQNPYTSSGTNYLDDIATSMLGAFDASNLNGFYYNNPESNSAYTVPNSSTTNNNTNTTNNNNTDNRTINMNPVFYVQSEEDAKLTVSELEKMLHEILNRDLNTMTGV